MARMKLRVSGSWVDSDRAGKVNYQGSDLAYGPPAGNDPVSLFTTQTPAGSFEDGIQMSLGVVMSFAVPGQITHVRWYSPASAPTGTVYAAVFGMDESRLTDEPDATFASTPSATWVTAELSSPVIISAPGQRMIGIKTPNRYPASTNSTSPASPFPLTNGPLSVEASGGRYTTFGNSSNRVEFPGDNFNNGCYFVDVVFVPD